MRWIKLSSKYGYFVALTISPVRVDRKFIYFLYFWHYTPRVGAEPQEYLLHSALWVLAHHFDLDLYIIIKIIDKKNDDLSKSYIEHSLNNSKDFSKIDGLTF